MNTNQLYKEYARVIEMCEGTELEDTPWVCVKVKGSILDFSHHPNFNAKNNFDAQNYVFAVAVLECKPVFVGDRIYYKRPIGIDEGVKVIKNNSGVMEFKLDNGICFSLGIYKNPCIEEHFTWTPPAPKRTFTLNGVDLPCPVDQIPFDDMNNPLQIGHCAFQFENEEDRRKVANMFIKLLTEARDKP